MVAQIEDIIYGADKKINFDKFNIGNLTKAITFNLEEFGKKGVQGVAIKTVDANNTITYSKSAGLKSPYIMAGTCKKDLVLVVRDGKNKTYEQMAVLVKGYADIKAELASNNAAVVNLHEGDKIIDGAARRQANKFGTDVQGQDDADFGDVTGNVLLCAHGTPKVNVGRVIGVELGDMTHKEIADLLTKNKDKSKRLAKDYDGKITLSGCFTAMGGPEALKADDPFAKKVWDELKKRGFKKCSVVGIPGVATTGSKGRKDDDGVAIKEGEKGAWARSEELLKALEKKAKVIRADIDKLTDKVVAAADKIEGDKSSFLVNPKVKQVLATITQKQDALNSLKAEMESIQADQKKYGDVDGKLMAHVTGTFGLRAIRSALSSN